VKELLVALVIAHGADSVTTARNIAAGVPERNRLLPRHVAANIAVSSAETIKQVKAFDVLAHHKPRLARTLAIVALCVESTVVGWNLRAHAEATRRP